MEGRAQQTYPALVPPGQARVDWKIIRVLSEVLDEKLPYDNINELRARMAEVAPNLVRYGSVEQANFFNESMKLSTRQVATHVIDWLTVCLIGRLID